MFRVWSHWWSTCPEDLAVGSGPSSAGVSNNFELDWAVEQSSNLTHPAVTGDPESFYSVI